MIIQDTARVQYDQILSARHIRGKAPFYFRFPSSFKQVAALAGTCVECLVRATLGISQVSVQTAQPWRTVQCIRVFPCWLGIYEALCV
jgi:hypothetical protein